MTEQELRVLKDKYNAKKKTTKKRVDKAGQPIKFNLTFEEWLAIWLASGQINNMGTRKGQYGMSRVNDLGHYEVGNVFIQLTSENTREGKLGRPASQFTKDKMSAKRAGLAKSEDHKTAIAVGNADRGSRIDGACEHCGYQGNAQVLGRYHGMKCKHRDQLKLI